MGKNLRGKECGKGVSQRKDGWYTARFTDCLGRRREKFFKTLPEARNWLEDARYADRHSDVYAPSDLTVDAWFDYWLKNIVGNRAPNTIRNYRERYKRNIQPVIGKMLLSDVKPMHCQMILNRMEQEYAGSTIRQTYICMGTMLRAAVNNDLLAKHPMDAGVRFAKPARAPNDIRFLTIDEQRSFLEVAKQSHNYDQFALLLETGLRTGEMVGLTWNDIDWDKRTLTVERTLEYRYKEGRWRAGPPKSLHGYRTIPLTGTAYDILTRLYDGAPNRKESDLLSQVLEYKDLRTGETKCMVMRDLVFINWRTGEPEKNSSYDTHLYKLCDKAGIKRFSMHALRHTFATRAIERNVPAKALQRLLGHATLAMTTDRYVHVTEDSLFNAVRQFEIGA